MLNKRKERNFCDEEQILSSSKEIKLTINTSVSELKPDIVFIDTENKDEYLELVLSWLQSDFEKKGKPNNHFWHNKDTIGNTFCTCNAMVALIKGHVVGYMTWNITHDISAEIAIVEVREEYRKQGIFNKMLSRFNEKMTNIYLLTAFVLPQSENVFAKLGWDNISIEKRNNKKIYYKFLKSSLPSYDKVPDGYVIGLCVVDFYKVKNNLNKYKKLMKYYQIGLDENEKLLTPLITPLHSENYIGIYYNKELIAQGKASHLFVDDTLSIYNNFLVMGVFKLLNPKLLKRNETIQQGYKVNEAISPGNQNAPTRSVNFFKSSQTVIQENESMNRIQGEQDDKEKYFHKK